MSQKSTWRLVVTPVTHSELTRLRIERLRSGYEQNVLKEQATLLLNLDQGGMQLFCFLSSNRDEKNRKIVESYLHRCACSYEGDEGADALKRLLQNHPFAIAGVADGVNRVIRTELALEEEERWPLLFSTLLRFCSYAVEVEEEVRILLVVP